MNHKISIASDGTLEVTVPEGTDVKRVLVSEAGTNYGSLYYLDEQKAISDDDDVVIFCNPDIADEFIKDDVDLRDALISTELLSREECIVVRRDDFLEWLKGEETE